MIKLIGFDLDDTLWDVAPIIRNAESHLNQWLIENVPALKFDVISDALWKLRPALSE